MRVPIADVPPRYKVPVAELVRPPVPASAVATVSDPLFVRVMVVTVRLGIEIVPARAWAEVVKL